MIILTWPTSPLAPSHTEDKAETEPGRWKRRRRRANWRRRNPLSADSEPSWVSDAELPLIIPPRDPRPPGEADRWWFGGASACDGQVGAGSWLWIRNSPRHYSIQFGRVFRCRGGKSWRNEFPRPRQSSTTSPRQHSSGLVRGACREDKRRQTP